MHKHDLKIDPPMLAVVASGHKTFEYRRNDRDFKPGDVLNLQGFDRVKGIYTGGSVVRRVGIVLYGPDYGVPEDFCVMSLLPVR